MRRRWWPRRTTARPSRKGLLKIFSKMGICTISAYRGSELFEIIGLDEDVTVQAFGFAHRRVDGIGFDELGQAALARHALYTGGDEDPGGFYKHRRGGIPHITSPKVVLNLQKAVRAGDYEAWEAYLAEINEREPAVLRDLLALQGGRSDSPRGGGAGRGDHAPLQHRGHVARCPVARSP